jgi:hypothetical protein
MDIYHSPRGQALLWHHIETAFAALAVWTERIPGKGEDADPLVLFHRPTGHGLISVFDGAGGAGRAVAGTNAAGVERTQAWVASRRVRGLVEEWFVGCSSTTWLGEHIAERLGAGVHGSRRMRGTMHRQFPTTLAGLDFRVTDTEVWWEVLWAGDSRCYVAEAGPGLQQLSRDDVESADALELLVADPPMTNLVSVSQTFALNRWRGWAQLPCLLVCATDGWFGYVETPAQFEHVLWETLLGAQDIRHWSALLAERVGSYTGDDASLAVAALGFGRFDDLRAHFRKRANRVRIEHAEPMRRIHPGNHTELVAARERSWRSYRPDYERRLRVAQGETG